MSNAVSIDRQKRYNKTLLCKKKIQYNFQLTSSHNINKVKKVIISKMKPLKTIKNEMYNLNICNI